MQRITCASGNSSSFLKGSGITWQDQHALDLACKFYRNPNLCIRDIRPTKLIDFKNIALWFSVNIRLYEPKVDNANAAWKLVFRQAQHRRSLPSINISLFEGHCFYIKNLDILTDHWECAGCEQRFSYHNNYDRHVTKEQCTGGQPKLVSDGGKFKCIMSSEKVFYVANMQFSWKVAGGSSASPSLVAGTFTMCCAVMEEKAVWSLARTKRSWSMGMTLRCQPSINSMDASGIVALAWDQPMASTDTA